MSASIAPSPTHPKHREERIRRHHERGFWVVTVTFTLLMAFATVPAPLYPLYQERDGFQPLTTTLIFAAYGLGVMLALWLVGHISDIHGRRRMILLALGLELVAAALFLLWNDVAGLLLARAVTGLGVGTLTSAATAHLRELRVRSRADEAAVAGATTISGAANLGGLGVGALAAGVLADIFPHPLHVPYGVFVVALLLALVAMLFVPETVDVPGQRPAYRPQPVRAPEGKAPDFWAAGAGLFAAMAVLGLFTSLSPTVLRHVFGLASGLAAGVVTFVLFAAVALMPIFCARLSPKRQLRLGGLVLISGLAALLAGVLTAAFPLFLTAEVLVGAGVGLLFRSAIGIGAAIARPDQRGGTVAALFLIGYAGMSVPVVAAGAALLVAPLLAVLIAYIALVAVLTAAATRQLSRVH